MKVAKAREVNNGHNRKFEAGRLNHAISCIEEHQVGSSEDSVV